MKKRVLAVIPCSYGGGAERLVLDQLKYYNKDKFDYNVVAMRKGNIDYQFVKLRNYTCLNAKSRFSINPLKKLIKITKKNKIEILHTHLLEADVYGFLVKIFNPKIKWITTKHNNDEFRKRIFWRIVNRIIALGNTKIIAVSTAVKKFVMKHEFLKDREVIAIPNGVDTKRFKPLQVKKIRKELGIMNKDFAVGVVGRLNYQKGHIFLLKTAKILKDKIKNLKILIVGDGELEKDLKAKSKELGIDDVVIFSGFRKDIENVYNSFNIFCLPSRFEGLPLVLIEAMSCEKPIICSDIENNRVVVNNNKEGILVKVGDVKGLSDAIYKFYKNPKLAKIMSKNARKKVVKKFDYMTNLKRIEEVYSNV